MRACVRRPRESSARRGISWAPRSARGLAGSQPRRQLLDDEQRPDPTARTLGDIFAGQPEQQRVPSFRLPGGVRFDGDRRRGEPLAHPGQGLQAHRVGQESVVADPDEAAGQDVEQKPAEEGGGIERGEPGGVAMGAVLPAEGDLAVLHIDEPIVGEGDAIGIAAEVGKDLRSPGEGGLAVHDPFLPRSLLEWATGVPVRSTNRPVVERVLEQTQQRAAEDLREHAHGQEEVPAGRDPAGCFDVEPPAGDDAVDMRMVEQLLGPGVQDRGEADRGAEAPAGDRFERRGRGGEQQAVRYRRRAEEEGVQLGGHGEDEVEILHGEQIALPGLDPPGFVQPLALGAVPIAAGNGELSIPCLMGSDSLWGVTPWTCECYADVPQVALPIKIRP